MSAQPADTPVRALTVQDFHTMREQGDKIACLTAYDATFATLEDQAGVDIILVGDSLGMVIQGLRTTVPVTMDDLVYHTRCVAAGLNAQPRGSRAFLMADMPFLSDATPAHAVTNAGRLLKEGGAKMVKLEGYDRQVDIVRALAEHGIPVCAHLGLQPQMVHKLGGFKVQGRDASAADAMQAKAEQLVAAGADMLLLECVPTGLGRAITQAASVPVIGIGAGAEVDGQILVVHDMLGATGGRQPRFVKNFLDGQPGIAEAVRAYVQAVKQGDYPALEQTFGE